MEGKSEGIKSFKVIDIVQVAVMAALALAVTYLTGFPVGGGAEMHLGDTIVFMAAALLGGRKAFLAGAIGMSLSDIISQFIVWAPYTFIIKGVMGLIAGVIVYRNIRGENKAWINAAGFAIAGAWMSVGYFFASRIIYGNYGAAWVALPWDIIQVIVGIIIAIPLINALRKTNIVKK